MRYPPVGWPPSRPVNDPSAAVTINQPLDFWNWGTCGYSFGPINLLPPSILTAKGLNSSMEQKRSVSTSVDRLDLMRPSFSFYLRSLLGRIIFALLHLYPALLMILLIKFFETWTPCWDKHRQMSSNFHEVLLMLWSDGGEWIVEMRAAFIVLSSPFRIRRGRSRKRPSVPSSLNFSQCLQTVAGDVFKARQSVDMVIPSSLARISKAFLLSLCGPFATLFNNSAVCWGLSFIFSVQGTAADLTLLAWAFQDPWCLLNVAILKNLALLSRLPASIPPFSELGSSAVLVRKQKTCIQCPCLVITER